MRPSLLPRPMPSCSGPPSNHLLFLQVKPSCVSTSSPADAAASSSMFPKHFLHHILVIYFSLSPLRLHGLILFIPVSSAQASEPGMLHFQVEQQVISSGVGSLKFIVFSFFLLNLFNILNRVATK